MEDDGRRQDGKGLTLDFGPRGQVVVVPDGSALARAAAEQFARAVERRSPNAGPPSSHSPVAPRRSRWARSWRANPIARGFLGIASTFSGATSAGFPSGRRRVTRARPGADSSIWCRSHRATSTLGTRPRNPLGKRPPPTRPCCASSLPSLSEFLASTWCCSAWRRWAYGVAVSEHRRLRPQRPADRRELRAKNGRHSVDTHRAGAQRRPRDPLPRRRAGKADTLEAVLEGPELPAKFPAQLIRPALPDGRLCWLVDEDAGTKLLRSR